MGIVEFVSTTALGIGKRSIRPVSVFSPFTPLGAVVKVSSTRLIILSLYFGSCCHIWVLVFFTLALVFFTLAQ